MIKYVFFDLDDTILDFKQEEKIALTRTLRQLGAEPEPELLSRYSEINISQWKLLELGKISREQVKVRRYQLLFEEFNLSLSPEETTAVYENMLADGGKCFIENSVDTLETLLGKYKMYLVSNGATLVQEGRLDNSGLRKYFDGIYISQQLGVNKPDKRFFDICFSEIPDFDKSQAVIIGDSLTSDIQGGINAGIKTIWFNHRNEQLTDIKPDYEITSLLKLPELLTKI